MLLSTLRLPDHHHLRAERREDLIEELHEFHFAQQTRAPDHIGIALVELAVPALQDEWRATAGSGSA
ncbi:MAG: hypothetical protein IPM12_14890 [Flavobacteriales bacterium]|nr:hypothetical protein [Flavobacteriales bacterium]